MWLDDDDAKDFSRLNYSLGELVRLMQESIAEDKAMRTDLGLLAAPTAFSQAGKSSTLHQTLHPTFGIPMTLEQFNEVIGMTGYAGEASPQAVQQDTVVPAATSSGASTTLVSYQVPSGRISVGFSPIQTSFTEYTSDLTVTIWMDKGLSAQLAAAVDLPATATLMIPRGVVGSHPIYDNLTGEFVNAGTSAITATVSGVVLQITDALWRDVYEPFFTFQYQYLKKLVTRLAQGGL